MWQYGNSRCSTTCRPEGSIRKCSVRGTTCMPRRLILGDGRYLLIKPVGRGGFGVVWEAHDSVEKRPVAIKVLHQHLAGESQRRERFFRGARVMLDLNHPAVVRVYDPRREEGALCYFVMELMPSGNLRDAVLGQRIESEYRMRLILQVGEALAEAHGRQLVHRDVKPANILLSEQGSAKLTDFDLVGVQDTTGGTRTGALGTVVYAAPECLERPGEATARADVYGLRMTAIFCLSGRELSLDTFRNPDPTIAALVCSDRIRGVLRRAVAWEPRARFADAGVMVAQLRHALERDGAHHAPSAHDAGSNATMQSRRSLQPIALAARRISLREPWRLTIVLAALVTPIVAWAEFSWFARPQLSRGTMTPQVGQTVMTAQRPAGTLNNIPWTGLNLDFELSETPTGWSRSTTLFVWAIVDSPTHGGNRSLQLQSAKDSFGAAIASASAEPVRGQRLKLRGWVKTLNVQGSAGMFLRIDGNLEPHILAFNNLAGQGMQAGGMTGTTDWTEVAVDVDVPEQAKRVVFGPLLSGEGVAWFDDLSFEVSAH